MPLRDQKQQQHRRTQGPGTYRRARTRCMCMFRAWAFHYRPRRSCKAALQRVPRQQLQQIQQVRYSRRLALPSLDSLHMSLRQGLRTLLRRVWALPSLRGRTRLCARRLFKRGYPCRCALHCRSRNHSCLVPHPQGGILLRSALGLRETSQPDARFSNILLKMRR